MLKLLQPDMYVSSLHKIDLERLQQRGIKGIIFDLDNTLTEWNAYDLHPETLQWIEMLHTRGFSLCVVSNNNKERRVKTVAERLGIPFIYKARKPRRRAFYVAMELLATSPYETAVVGDQIFTDVLGGNRLGLYTILVVPRSEQEMFLTKLMRLVEKPLVYSLKKHGLWDEIGQ